MAKSVTRIHPAKALFLVLLTAALFCLCACAQEEATTDPPLPQHWSLPDLTAPGDTCSLLPQSAIEAGAIVHYASSDLSVVSVDLDGQITAVGPGEAVITITVEQDGQTVEHTADIACIFD